MFVRKKIILGISFACLFASIQPIYAQEAPPEGGGNPAQGMPGSDASNISYSSVKDCSEDTKIKDETLEASGSDESVVHNSNGASTTISNTTINQTSDSSTGGDDASFYGVGAAILNTDGTLYVKDSTVSTDAKGGAGLFSYGDGKTYVSNTKINTKEDTAGGLHVAGGGILYAWNCKVKTHGQSSAALRSDRGGGTMVVNGGTYSTTGTGSPAIYSTANIAVKKVTLLAENSEATCIEGDNSVYLYQSTLTGNMPEDSQNDCTWNVILYQSMSGDSQEGNATFQMVGGTLTAKNGGMFYTTNTQSTITLKDVKINNAEASDFLLKCTGNSNERGWGESGSNGANCTFTTYQQKMEGNVLWDSISNLNMLLCDSSNFTGAILQDESNAGNGGDGSCNVTIDKDSTWIVTGDSVCTSLNNAGTIIDANGKKVTIQSSDGTIYVKGSSEYTITVSSYSDEANTSQATSLTSWSDFKEEKPSELK